MLMFDPQYVRPDDVGTQRNKILLLTKPESVQEVESVAYRDRDQAGSKAIPHPVIAHERRKTESRDRRQHERRQENNLPLLDTRCNRERRKQRRREHDGLLSWAEKPSNRLRVGVNEVV
ncbi:hypothetical protein MNBD_GAMMA17-1129 [hydrothermal vent metagenome]|uniref:Uncharacterized protein n=1 Tax=hydrothermal vent metagenome TaxID=652676 RepID=A0A3B1A6E9_9ZZZZ